MISKEELRSWLRDESFRPLIDDSPKHGTQVFIKVPKDEEFIYLYRQYCYDKEDVVRRSDKFENSGIYNKLDGKIYFAHGYFDNIAFGGRVNKLPSIFIVIVHSSQIYSNYKEALQPLLEAIPQNISTIMPSEALKQSVMEFYLYLIEQ